MVMKTNEQAAVVQAVGARHGVYARTESKQCPMHDDVCAATVIQHISNTYPQPFDATELVETACGRYTRGKHVGKLRGWATINVVTVGGWRREGPGYRNGRVMYPGTIASISITDYNGNPYFQSEG